MKKKYYLPTDQAQRVIWLNNFSSKLNATYGTIFGIAAGLVSLIVSFATFYAFMVDLQFQLKKFKEDMTKYFKDFTDSAANTPVAAFPVFAIPAPTLPASGGMWAVVRALVKNIKSNSLYTPAAGEDLGIIGDEHDIDVDTAKPELKFTKEPHGWRVEFALLNFFNGVSIYKKLPAATEFTHLATDRHSPYIDNATVENGTQYYAFFLLGDDEVGQPSDTTTLKVNN